MKVRIAAISYHFPAKVETSVDLLRDNPEWDMAKIMAKTGIDTRYIAAAGETASDLAFAAADKLLTKQDCRDQIDLLILVTQSPDYALPTSACILQNRLNLATNSMAFDVNLGCSGFIYALSIAGGLIESGVARKGLILCADTYSKYIDKHDRTCRPIFSDGAAAILVEASSTDDLGPFVYGTDGSGYDRLIVKQSGARIDNTLVSSVPCNLEMHGSDVFMFSMRVIPVCVNQLLERSQLKLDDIDLFVFHQASKLVIDNLIRHLSLDRDKVFINYNTVGNTVCAATPIALQDAATQGRLLGGERVMLVGFGVGLSWGATLIRWTRS